MSTAPRYWQLCTFFSFPPFRELNPCHYHFLEVFGHQVAFHKTCASPPNHIIKVLPAFTIYRRSYLSISDFFQSCLMLKVIPFHHVYILYKPSLKKSASCLGCKRPYHRVEMSSTAPALYILDERIVKIEPESVRNKYMNV